MPRLSGHWQLFGGEFMAGVWGHGACFATSLEAAGSVAAHNQGVFQRGTTLASVSVSSYNTTSITYSVKPEGTGTATTIVAPFASVSCGQVLNPLAATVDDYTAVGVVFGVILAAMAAVWGVKKVIAVFSNPAEA